MAESHQFSGGNKYEKWRIWRITSAGTAGTLAGTITSAGVMTITAGGAGTVATGQHVTELTIK